MDLLSDQAALNASGAATGPLTDLDLDSIKFLLGLDPFVSSQSPSLGPPRFVPNDPASDAGDADPSKTVKETHEISTADSNSHQSLQTSITDVTPGWLDALFGANVTDETQLTVTYAFTDTVTTTTVETAVVNVFGYYSFSLWFDTLFGSLAFSELQPATLLEHPVAGPIHVGPGA